MNYKIAMIQLRIFSLLDEHKRLHEESIIAILKDKNTSEEEIEQALLLTYIDETLKYDKLTGDWII